MMLVIEPDLGSFTCFVTLLVFFIIAPDALRVAELDKNIMCLVNFHQEISMVSFTAAQSAGSLRWQTDTASVGASCGGGDGRLCSMDVGSGFVSACI